jgi:AmmeMemoRadiSam system protein B
MTRRKIKIWLLFTAILLLIPVLYYSVNNDQKNISNGEDLSEAIDVSAFFDESLFYKGIYESQASPVTNIRAGVLPHHLLASVFISETLKSLPKETATIILIGPNHEEKGNSKFIISGQIWNTPYGLVYSDSEFAAILSKNEFIKTDDEIISNEHSVGAIIPYIKYLLPGAKVIPIIVKQKIDPSEIESVSDTLSQLLKRNENSVILVSTDFSHYLNVSEANEKDGETLNSIKMRDYSKIVSYGNDNIDSPASLVLLMKSIEKLGDFEINVLNHSNSGILMNKPDSQTTSYFSIVFQQR